jgi:arylsulfatase A-like enzyme
MVRSLIVIVTVIASLLAAGRAFGEEPLHPVFSLADNRLLAHVQRGGGVVAIAGSAGFAKYLNGGRPNLPFRLAGKLEGHRVAVSEALSRVILPLGPGQSAGAVWLRVSSPKARELELSLNGKSLGRVAVASGWQTLHAAVPAGAARVGENELLLSWSGKADGPAVEWIQLGGAEPPADAAPAYWDAAQKSLVLPQGGGLAWYLQIPAQAVLAAEVSGAGCEVSVRARVHDGATVEGTLRGGARAPVSLGALAGKVARLDLALVPSSCPEARLSAAALLTPGPAPTVVRRARPKNVVLWIMDSLRADKLRPFFAGARAEVPNLEKLAKTSTLFLNTYVQGNESRASHASIWASAYVATHRMIGDKDVLDARWLTVGEAMRAAGLYTAGVSANGWIIGRWGFGDGWDFFVNHIHTDGGTRGEDVWAAARKAIADRVRKPFFLYLGFVDTHVSWRAHEPWISRYDPGPYDGRFRRVASDPEVDAIAAGKLAITERDKTRIIAIYDSDVSYQDDLVGKVMDQLAGWGVADDTMLVITADHGDELWEDGRVGHGGSLHETLVHVPLLIHYPPLFPAGAVTEGAESVDILPTLMDALGAEPAPEMQGESLIGLAQGVGRGYPRPSVASMYEDALAMRLGDWKLVVRASGAPRVYDAVKDHLERTDLAETRPLERRFLTDAMSTFLIYQKEWKKRRWGVASNQTARFAEDTDR